MEGVKILGPWNTTNAPHPLFRPAESSDKGLEDLEVVRIIMVCVSGAGAGSCEYVGIGRGRFL